jgi:hypothetical protein
VDPRNFGCGQPGCQCGRIKDVYNALLEEVQPIFKRHTDKLEAVQDKVAVLALLRSSIDRDLRQVAAPLGPPDGVIDIALVPIGPGGGPPGPAAMAQAILSAILGGPVPPPEEMAGAQQEAPQETPVDGNGNGAGADGVAGKNRLSGDPFSFDFLKSLNPHHHHGGQDGKAPS